MVNKIVEKEPQFRLLIAGAGSIGNVNLSLIKSKKFVQLGFISDERKLELAQHCRIIINPGRIGLNAIDSLALALPIVGLKNSHHAPEYEYLNSRNSFLVDSYDEMILTVHNLTQDDTQLLNKAIQCVQDAQQYQLEYMVDNFVRGTLKAVSN